MKRTYWVTLRTIPAEELQTAREWLNSHGLKDAKYNILSTTKGASFAINDELLAVQFKLTFSDYL